MTRPATQHYFQWINREIRQAAFLGPLEGAGNGLYRAIQAGERVADRFPKDAAFRMRTGPPKDRLVDHFFDSTGLTIISEKFQNFLRAQEDLADIIELLPVNLINHRGGVASDSYAILNVCNVVDCIDQDRSDFEWNVIAPTEMCPVRELVFDPARLGEHRLFRSRYLTHLVMVRQDLAEHLMAQEFSGLWMILPDP